MKQFLFAIPTYLVLAMLAAPGFSAAKQTKVIVIRVPDGGVQPQALMDSSGRVHLVYCKGDPTHGDAFYVHSDDNGSTFSNPIRVNSQPGSVVAIGTVRGPHLALGRNDRVHAAWMGSSTAEPKLAANQPPMLYTRLSSTGDTFEPQRNVIHDHPGLNGGGSIAADHNGNVYVAWHAPQTLPGTEADRHVWLARSKDDGRTFAPELDFTPGDRGTCGCCGMKLFANDDGVFALYRSASEMVHRDIYFVASNDFGKSPVSLDLGPWEIGACAMSTSAMASMPNGHVAIAFEQEGNIVLGAIQPAEHATLSLSRVLGNGGNRKHPAIAVGQDGTVLVAWTEGTGWARGGRVVWQSFDQKNQLLDKGGADGLPAWDMPAVGATRDGHFLLFY